MDSKPLISITTWGVIAVIFLLAVVAPDDILTRSKFLDNLTGALAAFIPSIDNLSHLSKFPEVTKFVLSVAWILAVLVFIVYVYVALKIYVPEKTIERLQRTKIIVTLITYIFIPAMILAFTFLIGGERPRESGGLPGEMLVRGASESRIILAFLAVMTSVFVGFACMFIVYWTKLLPTLFGKERREH